MLFRSGVLLELLNAGTSIIATTLTDSKGEYIFRNVEPGDYSVRERNPSSHPLNVSDYDTLSDGDDTDDETAVDDLVGVSLKPGENDDGNDFVDSNKGSISGGVTDEVGEPLKNVTLTLTKPDGSTITTVTDSNGGYTFVGVRVTFFSGSPFSSVTPPPIDPLLLSTKSLPSSTSFSLTVTPMKLSTLVSGSVASPSGRVS